MRACQMGARLKALITYLPSYHILWRPLFCYCFDALIIFFGYGFGAAAEVDGKESFGSCGEYKSVFGACEAVAFVREEQVLHRLVVLAHRFDDLVTLGLLHARIVCPLSDQ